MPKQIKYTKDQCIDMLRTAVNGLIYAIETRDPEEHRIAIKYAQQIMQICREDLI